MARGVLGGVRTPERIFEPAVGDLRNILAQNQAQQPSRDTGPEFPSRASALGQQSEQQRTGGNGSAPGIGRLSQPIGTLPSATGFQPTPGGGVQRIVQSGPLDLSDVLGVEAFLGEGGEVFRRTQSGEQETIADFGGLPSQEDEVTIGGETLSGFKRIDIEGVPLLLNARGQVFRGEDLREQQAIIGDSTSQLANRLRQRIFGRQATILTGGNVGAPNVQPRVLTGAGNS